MAESNPLSQDLGIQWTPKLSLDSFPIWNPKSQGVMCFSDNPPNRSSVVSSVFVFYINMSAIIYITAPGFLQSAMMQVAGDSFVLDVFGLSNEAFPSWGIQWKDDGLLVFRCFWASQSVVEAPCIFDFKILLWLGDSPFSVTSEPDAIDVPII